MTRQQTLTDLLRIAKIDDDWDAILVTDGSGSRWGAAAGWGAVLIEKGHIERSIYYGHLNSGTNNIGELMAILHPLLALVAKKDSSSFLRVYVVTDSQYATTMSREDKGGVHAPIRHLFADIAAQGIMLCWRHVGRDILDLNRLADGISKLARQRLNGKLVYEALSELETDAVEQVNPG